MLGTRLVFGVLMVGLFVTALVIDESLAPLYPAWLLLSSAALLLAAREIASLLSETAAAPSTNSVIGGVMAIVIANWAPHLSVRRDSSPLSGIEYDPAGPLHVFAWPFLTFSAVVMLCFLIQGLQYDRPGRTMARIAGTVFSVAYLGLFASFTLQMRWLPGTHQGLMALAFLFATAKGSDTGAYTFGRLFGKRKLWPALSPGKTVEGAAGGVLAGVLAAVLAAEFSRRLLVIPSLSLGHAALYGILVSAAAQVGDLMESLIKRDCQRKDASSSVPGFGGVLDVLDSLLFAGPVAYLLWMQFGP